MQHTKRHRHAVATLMALTVFALVAFGNAALATRASVVDTDSLSILEPETKKQVVLASGTQLDVDASSRLRLDTDGIGFTLDRGSVIVDSPAFTQVVAGDVSVALGFGRAFILHEMSSVTVVALGSPLLYASQGKRHLLVPGYQVRSDTRGTLQESLVPREWQQAFDVSGDAAPFDSNVITSSSVRITKVHELARLRRSHPPDVEAILAVAGSIDRSLPMLHALSLASGASAMHADLQAAITTALFDSSGHEMDLVAALPRFLLSSPRPFPAAVIDAWEDRAVRYLALSPSAFFTLLRSLEPLPDILEASGFPVQARRWRHALHVTSEVLLPLMASAAEQQHELQPNQQNDTTFTAPTSADDARYDQHRLSEERVIALTEHMLYEYAILRGPSTQILLTTDDDQSAHVSGVFLQEEGRDVPYAFTYTPATRLVSAIAREGVLLPNSVPADRFFTE